MRVNKYRRGQIWWYHPGGEYEGHTYNQGKSRPIIIVSNNLANTYSSYLLAIPCTSKDKKPMPTHMTFDLNGTYTTSMAESLMCVEVSKIGDYIGTVDEELMEQIESTVLIALGIQEISKNAKIEKIELAEDTSLEIEETSSLEPLTLVKRGRHPKYSLDDKIRFVNDYENHDKEYMLQKYNLDSVKVLSNRLYRFRKFIEENENDRSEKCVTSA